MSNKKNKIICDVFFILSSFFILGSYCDECISIKDQECCSHLATKTPYRFVENQDISPLKYPGCEAKGIWMVIRHGTRNPGTKYIKALDRLIQIQKVFVKNHEKSKLCKEEVNNILKWEPYENLVGREKFLTGEGESELQELAKRMQKRLPELFPKLYSNASYKFKYTKNQRAELSAKLFAVGLFNASKSDVRFPEALHKDPILRFYKCCDKWRYEIDKNPETIKEKRKFEKTDIVLNMIANIINRLGLPDGFLDYQDIYFMYSYCAFETAWNRNKIGDWCSAFTTPDFVILEYAEDLEYFWIDGYGYNLTYKQACVAIRDMLQHFKDDNIAPASFYFTHSGTLLKMIAHLGLYRDSKPLTHIMQNDRLWRVSKIDAFGSNLAFIKFSCGEEKKPFLLLLHQERPIHIPGCPGYSVLCPMDIFIKVHDNNQKTCDFKTMCSISTRDVCENNMMWLLRQFYKCYT